MSAFYDVRDVKNAAHGQWASILTRFGANGALLKNQHGPCPGCGGRDRFRFDDLDGHGSFLCSQGGSGILAGDGFALLGHITGWEWKRCVGEVGQALNVAPRRGTVSPDPVKNWNAGVADEPESAGVKCPELDRFAVTEFTRGTPPVDADWLARRSPVDVGACDTIGFLRRLYRDDERVLIFTDEHSQGDFIAWRKPDELDGSDPTVRTFRLSQKQGTTAVPSALPAGGGKGVWFLTNPVDGIWRINPRARNRDGEDEPKWSRRSAESITSWRFFVLESDELEEGLWLQVLANLQLPICAIYSSGKRSIHALVEFELPTKAHWDATRDVLRRMVCPLGADPGAMSAVRLSRLPGCSRGTPGKSQLQRMLYLNPRPDHSMIRLQPEKR